MGRLLFHVVLAFTVLVSPLACCCTQAALAAAVKPAPTADGERPCCCHDSGRSGCRPFGGPESSHAPSHVPAKHAPGSCPCKQAHSWGLQPTGPGRDSLPAPTWIDLTPDVAAFPAPVLDHNADTSAGGWAMPGSGLPTGRDFLRAVPVLRL
jgi:hypothetical protein